MKKKIKDLISLLAIAVESDNMKLIKTVSVELTDLLSKYIKNIDDDVKKG